MTLTPHLKFPSGQVKVGLATERGTAHPLVDAPVVETVIESRLTVCEALDGLKWSYGEYYRDGVMVDFKMWRKY